MNVHGSTEIKIRKHKMYSFWYTTDESENEMTMPKIVHQKPAGYRIGKKMRWYAFDAVVRGRK